MKIKALLFCIAISSIIDAQVSTVGHVGLPTDYLGWNAGNPFPARIEHRGNQPINFATNTFTRMILNNGPGNQTGGRLALGNNLPFGFAPVDRLHLHHVGFNNLNTYMRFTNSITGPTGSDGFAVGNSSFNGITDGVARLIQYETAPIVMYAPNQNTPTALPWEWFRIENDTTFQAAPLPAPTRITDGYIGLNKHNPRSHIEMITPAFQGGEEFFMAKPSDIFDLPANPTVLAPNVQMGMMNASGVNGRFLPCFFGNINQQFQPGPAVQMLGAIHIAQDIPGNLPVVRFIAAREWTVNANLPNPLFGTQASSVINRPIFSWQNADNIHMYMAANGRARIGSSLLVANPAIPPQRPNNRFEITA
jgi:hypothetical protein